MDSLISIIIPVYNAEKTLKNCMESVFKQSYRNIEILLINDGSTDSSPGICDDLGNMDNRVKVYHIKNSGSGPARNVGLENAKGDFAIFVDSDDWIDEKLVEILYKSYYRTKSDLVAGRIVDVRSMPKNNKTGNTDEDICLVYEDKEKARENFIRMLRAGIIMGPVCKLYSLDIIRDKNIRFPELRRSQDIVFNYRYFEHVSKCIIIPNTLYYVRYNKDYIKKIPQSYYETVKIIFDDLSAMLIEWGFNEKSAQWNELIDYCFDSIALNIESNVLNHKSLTLILTDPFVQMLSKTVIPLKVMNKIIKFMLVRNRIYGLKIIVMLRNRLRKIKNKF